MHNRTKRWVLAGGGIAAIAVVVAGVLLLWSGGEPEAVHKPERVSPGTVAQQFFTAVTSGQAGQAGQVTDAAQAATAAITRTREGMTGAAFRAQLGEPPQPPAGATTTEVDATITWTLPGGTPLTYATKAELRLADDRWRVHWSPSLLHPQLAEGQSLAYTTTSGDGALVDRDGRPVPAGFAPVVMGS
ncbi:MAG: hypothetical protein HOV94_25985, partial [Saccharothrix sp.]|nr:hypothetical protein [Saccharothrix sp.]